MDKWMSSVFHFGSLVRREPPPLSPTFDEAEILQFLKPAYDLEHSKDFKVLLNVTLLDPNEVSIEVIDGKYLELRAAHGRKRDADGMWLSREIKYTYEIPEESRGKPLYAEWSEDEYLLIRTKPGKGEIANVGRIRLVPEKVPCMVRPAVELRVVRDIVQDIRDKAADALRYIVTHTHVQESTTEDEKKSLKSKTRYPKGAKIVFKRSDEKMECEDIAGELQMTDPPIHYYCA